MGQKRLEGTWLHRLQLKPGAERRELWVCKELRSTSFIFKVKIIFTVSWVRRASLVSKSVQGNSFTPVTDMPNLYHFVVLPKTEKNVDRKTSS